MNSEIHQTIDGACQYLQDNMVTLLIKSGILELNEVIEVLLFRLQTLMRKVVLNTLDVIAVKKHIRLLEGIRE